MGFYGVFTDEESVGNAQKFAGRREGGGGGGARSAGLICKLFGFKIGVANMQKNTVNYDKIASWESLLGYKFVQK